MSVREAHRRCALATKISNQGSLSRWRRANDNGERKPLPNGRRVRTATRAAKLKQLNEEIYGLRS